VRGLKVVKRSVGIPGIKTPEKTCNDKNCPFHGTLSVRGAILRGKVVSKKMSKTVVILHEYLYYDRKYRRYERRRRKIKAHLPDCIEVNVGDRVIIGECRPLAKSISFVVLGKE